MERAAPQKLDASGPPTGLFPSGTVTSFHSRDFDEVASLPPLWEQKYSQIRPGHYEGDLFMAMTSRLVFSMERSSVGLMIRGCIPRDSAVIAVPFLGGETTTYQRERLSSRSAIIVFPGDEIDYRALAGFDLFLLVAERNLLERHAHRVLGRTIESLRRNGQGVVHDPAGLQRRVRAIIADLTARGEQAGLQLSDPVAAAALEGQACEAVLTGLAPRPPQKRNAERVELAWTVEHHLRSQLERGFRGEVSIDDLCRIAGAPKRTLHLAFREQIGSTPKAYLKTLLLNAARHDLRSAPAGTTVTDVATRWGFRHFGWFAHDYKAMFGQSPRESLHHNRPRRRRKLTSSTGGALALLG